MYLNILAVLKFAKTQNELNEPKQSNANESLIFGYTPIKDSHVLETTSMPLVLLSMPGQSQNIKL